MSVNDRLKRKRTDDTQDKNSRAAFGTRALVTREEKQASRDLAVRPTKEGVNIRYSNPKQPGIIANYLLGERASNSVEPAQPAPMEAAGALALMGEGGNALASTAPGLFDSVMSGAGAMMQSKPQIFSEDTQDALNGPDETTIEEVTFDSLHSTQAAGGMAQTYTGTKIEHSNLKHTVHHEIMTQHTITHENFYYITGSQFIHPFLEVSGILSMSKLWPETTCMSVDSASIDISNVYILDNKQDSSTGQVNSGLVQRGKCLMFKICSDGNNPFGLTDVNGTYYFENKNINATAHSEGYYYDLDATAYHFSCHTMSTNMAVAETGTWYPPDGLNFSSVKEADNGRSLVLAPETTGAYKDWRKIAVIQRQQLVTVRPWSTNQQTTGGNGYPFVGDDRMEYPYAKMSDVGVIYSDMNVTSNDTFRKSFVQDIGVHIAVPAFIGYNHVMPSWWGWSMGGLAIDGAVPSRIDNRLYAICPPLAFGGDTPHFRLPIVTNLKGHKLGKVRSSTLRRCRRQGNENGLAIAEINNNCLMSCPIIGAEYRYCPNTKFIDVEPTNGLLLREYNNADIMTFPVWPNYDNPVIYTDSWGNRDASNYHNHGSYKPLCHYFICMQTVKDTAGNPLPMAANFQLIHRMTTTQYLNDYWARGTLPRNLGQLRHGVDARASDANADWNPEFNLFM